MGGAWHTQETLDFPGDDWENDNMKNNRLNHECIASETENGVKTITLNRPEALNSLTMAMVRSIRAAMDRARSSDAVRLVVIQGAGGRAFCAGGDVKAVADAVREHRRQDAMAFFTEEYDLDLLIHRFSKPVIAIVDGITMGGGLGLAAGADIVIATERTRMAMPETRIGFFPDVGATGWMFEKCPPGYPEYLGLSGYEIKGRETVRLGFATHLMASRDLGEIRGILFKNAPLLTGTKDDVPLLSDLISSFARTIAFEENDTDSWVKNYFAGKTSMTGLLADLSQCSLFGDLCEGVFSRLSERSPTATVLTLALLRHNQGRPLEDVFAAEARAAEFMIGHPDYLEGIRARLVDKDNDPKWQPAAIEDVDLAMRF